MDDSGFEIRPATLDDCPGILAVYNEAVLTTTATYDYEARTLEHRRDWFVARQRNGFPVLVAVDVAGRVAGWSALNPYHDRIGYRFTVENSVYVAAESRGRGLGSRLLAPLIPAGESRGFHVIIAAIDADNAVSLHLHERHGFMTVGRFRRVGFKFGRWLDVVYMERLLAEPQVSG